MNVFATRLGRIADRVDKVIKASADHQRQLARLRLRSRVLDVAVLLATLAGALTCCAALTLFFGALRNTVTGKWLFGFFGGALICAVAALGGSPWRPSYPDAPFASRRNLVAVCRSVPRKSVSTAMPSIRAAKDVHDRAAVLRSASSGGGQSRWWAEAPVDARSMNRSGNRGASAFERFASWRKRIKTYRKGCGVTPFWVKRYDAAAAGADVGDFGRDDGGGGRSPKRREPRPLLTGAAPPFEAAAQRPVAQSVAILRKAPAAEKGARQPGRVRVWEASRAA